MKQALISTILILAATQTLAAQSTIYCKPGAKIFNAFSEEGHFQCVGDLAMGRACFTGDAQKVADLMNTNTLNWDEEWLEDATAPRNDEVIYLYVDGPNEEKAQVSMKRCADSFFKN